MAGKISIHSGPGVRAEGQREWYVYMTHLKDILDFTQEDLEHDPASDPSEFEYLMVYLKQESGLNDEAYSELPAYLHLLPWSLATLRRFLEAAERFQTQALARLAALPPVIDPENPTPDEIYAAVSEAVADLVVRKLRAHLEHYEGHPDRLRQDRINRWCRSGPNYILGDKFFAQSEFGRELAREHQPQA